MANLSYHVNRSNDLHKYYEKEHSVRSSNYLRELIIERRPTISAFTGLPYDGDPYYEKQFLRETALALYHRQVRKFQTKNRKLTSSKEKERIFLQSQKFVSDGYSSDKFVRSKKKSYLKKRSKYQYYR